MLVSNPRGNYRFLKGIGAYSSGVVAETGYEIVHSTLAQPVSVREGIELIERRLRASNRPVQALCAIELRSPCPFTFAGFTEFNDSYRSLLAGADLLLDGTNPIARTNVAPEVDPPSEPVLYGFSHTMPSVDTKSTTTFVVAGAGELLEDIYDEQHIVRFGETSDDAMRQKARCVLEHIARRVSGLAASLDLVTEVNVYTVQNIYPFLHEQIVNGFGAAARHGIRWHFARPPIAGLEFEMDVRSYGMELSYIS